FSQSSYHILKIHVFTTSFRTAPSRFVVSLIFISSALTRAALLTFTTGLQNILRSMGIWERWIKKQSSGPGNVM
ncbi:hypothetical protein BgiMline_018721, partial [Biomphalaria glabrata]